MNSTFAKVLPWPDEWIAFSPGVSVDFIALHPGLLRSAPLGLKPFKREASGTQWSFAENLFKREASNAKHQTRSVQSEASNLD